MASSRASSHFQHPETRCPLLQQKLQGSPVNFFVLEEDSTNLEVFLFGMDFHVSNLGVGLEEFPLLSDFNLGFSLCFFFPWNVLATNA